MTHALVRSLALLLLSFSVASAAEPERKAPVPLITGAVNYGGSLTSLTALPPSVAHGVGILVPLHNGWSYYTEAGFATSFTDFRPAPQLITGPSVRVSARLTLGATAVLKLVPSYGGAAPTMTIVGLSVAPIIPTTFGSVSTPCGAGYNLTVNDASIVCAMKISIRLK